MLEIESHSNFFIWKGLSECVKDNDDSGEMVAVPSVKLAKLSRNTATLDRTFESSADRAATSMTIKKAESDIQPGCNTVNRHSQNAHYCKLQKYAGIPTKRKLQPVMGDQTRGPLPQLNTHTEVNNILPVKLGGEIRAPSERTVVLLVELFDKTCKDGST